MGRGERIAVWVVLGLLALWLVVLSAISLGEVAALRRMLAGRPSPSTAETEPLPTPPARTEERESASGGVSVGGKFQVGVGGVSVVSDTLVLTVTVRSSGVGELLYEPPVVTDGAREYPATGESLEKARFAFLDLVTKGTATARLEFSPAPDPGGRLTLVFNPGQRPEDPLTPRMEVPVPRPARGGD